LLKLKGLLKAITLFFVASFIIIGLMGAYYAYHFFLTPLLLNENSYSFELKRGESLGHLASLLEKEAFINHVLPLKLYGRLTGLDKNLHAGEYLIEPNNHLLDLIQQLRQGSTLQRSVTFVEGWSYKQLLNALQKNHNMNWDFDEALFTKGLDIQSLGAEKKHLEGMFFADTYFYAKGQSVQTLLEQSHKKLLKVLMQEWKTRKSDLPFKNPYEALILASIVEKETGLASERPLIAGVFINRLRKKMRLQTDPTVIYGLGDTYKGNITRKHLTSYSPYNTYRIPALPPSPIAMVGQESIHAVLHYKPSQYIYFVAKGDGSHYFSATLAEHQKAVKQYQWNRVNGYRSSPK